MTTTQRRDFDHGARVGSDEARTCSEHNVRTMIGAASRLIARIDAGERADRVLGSGGTDEFFVRGKVAGATSTLEAQMAAAR